MIEMERKDALGNGDIAQEQTWKVPECSEVQELAGVGWSIRSIGHLRGTGGRWGVEGEMSGAWTEKVPRRIQV